YVTAIYFTKRRLSGISLFVLFSYETIFFIQSQIRKYKYQFMQLKEWFSEMGIVYMKSEIRLISEQNYGLVANTNIGVGTILAEIPQEALISVKKVKIKYRKIIKEYPHLFFDLLNDDYELNILTLFMYYLRYIRLLEKEGQYKIYFQSANPENILSNRNDIDLITDNNLQITIRQMKIGLQKNYQYFQTLFKEQFDTKLQYEDFLFAYQFVMTRCFSGDEAIESTSLVPFGDMLNHHWKCQIEFTYLQNDQIQNKYLYIKALENIEEGEQIYNFFGEKHNGFLFLWYGFCLEDNIYDKIFFIMENNSVSDYSIYEFPPQVKQFVLKYKKHKILSQDKQLFDNILNQLEQIINKMLQIPIPQYQILLKSHRNILQYQKELNK
ncbi:N-lysine methyltransferase setd6, partial [Paramecium bursaria]